MRLFGQSRKDNSANFALTEFSKFDIAPVQHPCAHRTQIGSLRVLVAVIHQHWLIHSEFIACCSNSIIVIGGLDDGGNLPVRGTNRSS
jgi:hypothetical protein